MLKYSHPTLALILDYWPIAIFMPTILLLIATLALITRWWDRRDQEARESVSRPPVPADGAVVHWESGRRHDPSKPSSPRPGQPIGSDGRDARAAS